ncbi:MAG: hypothetical protein IJ403_05005 [Oscillospiraceae bacterium]|nr:hypothetical protein [Oscillospiraceae bacterium]
MISIVLGIALIVGLMVADAILDWVFIALYTLSAMAILNSLIHLVKYHKKYNEIDTYYIGRIFIYLAITAVGVVLQVTLL